MKYINYFSFAIPFFVLAILLELLYQKRLKKRIYSYKDMVTNISCGIGQQALDVFLRIFIIAGYKFIYDHFRIFTVPVIFFTSFLLFILIDFSYYWFHRFAHRINIMWGTHMVHHQSEEFNLSVALRQSWFDNVFNWFFYIPLAVLGFNDVYFFAMFSLNTIYQFIIHTRTVNKLGFLELFMNTPSHHRVHHGRNSKYLDKNYGGVFIVWDKLFKTFEKEQEDVVYGITSPVNSSNPICLNISYWLKLKKDLKNIRMLKNKVLYLFYPPGTSADDGLSQPVICDTATGKVRQEAAKGSLKQRKCVYITVNFISIILILGILLSFETNYSEWVKAAATSFVLMSMIMIGEIMDENNRIKFIEAARIPMLNWVCILLLKDVVPGIAYLSSVVCFGLLLLHYHTFFKTSADEASG